MSFSWEELLLDQSDMPVYMVVPEGEGPFPAIVVIQAAGGVDEFIQTTANHLAGEGYAAVAPSLYHRSTEEIERDTGKTSRQLLEDPEVVADVNATVEFLRQHYSVDHDRIGITEFCMGGRVVWLAAATNPHFKAAVPFYGGFIMDRWGGVAESPFELSGQINCPLMFHFGEIDPNPSQEDLTIFDELLTRLGKPHQFYTYPGAEHRFMDHTFTAYQKEAAELSWSRTLNFFAANLKGAA
jgi:carboxymethylenebutenolidase